MEENIKEKDFATMLNEQLEEQKMKVVEEGINPENIEYLSELVDICKDLKKIEKIDYEMEESNMMYRESGYGYSNSGDYGRRSRDSRGRYNEGGQYGRRSSGGYRGHDMLDTMYQHYGNYGASRDEYHNSGDYRAKEDSKMALKKMLESAEDFMAMLMEEAESQEEVEMVKQTAKEIAMM